MAQNYPNFEHIVVDGASTDGTVDILKQYPHVRWVSEKDSGEAEALNKALRMVTGDIVSWLNVDDLYFDDTVLRTVIAAAGEHPQHGVFYGKGMAVNEECEVLWYRRPILTLDLPTLMRWFVPFNIFQPAMFYRREVLQDFGSFREDLHYAIDYDMWLRVAARGHTSFFIDRFLALATLVREGAKSGGSWEDQHLTWMEVSKPFQRFLSAAERVNYWKEFYFYMLRPPVTYTKALSVPEDEHELHGFAIAALECSHMPFAVQAVERLTALFPQSPDVYWILSEVLNKSGNHPLAVQAMKQGSDLSKAAAPVGKTV